MTVIDYSSPVESTPGRTLALLTRGPSLDEPIFCAQLVVLLRAGLGIVESLRALQANSVRSVERAVYASVLMQLGRGEKLSSALDRQRGVFSRLLVAMVKSAERTSSLPEALDRYVLYARDIDQLRAKVRAAAVYPIFLTGVGGLVILFLLIHVVPRFAGIYESLHTELPWAASLMLRWGQAVKTQWPVLLAGAGVLIGASVFALTRPSTGLMLVRMVGKTPLVGALVFRMQLARLYRTIAMLVGGGYPIYQAMGESDGLLPPHLRSALDVAALSVARGFPVSQALSEAGLTTPIAANLLLVGERSGELHKMFDEAAGFIELETGRTLEQTMRVIEPALMTVIGLTIGVIVVLMYLPIFELAGSL